MKGRMGRLMGWCVSTLLVAGAWPCIALAVECVSADLTKRCHSTIQHALLAADPGEEVSVFPGTYAENISVDTVGVRVVGKGGLGGQVVIRPAGGTAVSLNAPETMLKNVSVQGGEAGIVVTGAGAVVDGVKVVGCATGITVASDGVRVANSTIREIVGTGIGVAGKDFTLQSSAIKETGGQCVDVNGDGALISKNRIMACGAGGVNILGGAASVLENVLLVAQQDLISVNGPGARIRGNRLQGGRGAAIGVFSDAPIVLRNAASDCDTGIDVYCDSCDGGVVEGNIVSGIYNCEGFYVWAGAAGMVVRGNVSRDNSGGGFILRGLGLEVQGNIAVNNDLNGISVMFISADARLIDNRANRNSGDGIQIESGVTGTIVERNRAHGNGNLDFRNDGTGTILGEGSNRNSFGTVGGP